MQKEESSHGLGEQLRADPQLQSPKSLSQDMHQDNGERKFTQHEHLLDG